MRYGDDDTPVTVCLTHMRHIPCRKGAREGGCVLSTRAEDIERVRLFHVMPR